MANIAVFVLQVGEIVGGIFAHSLAVLTDAAHMLSDVMAFIIALCAGTYALRNSRASHTFGYHRAEVLGGMVRNCLQQALPCLCESDIQHHSTCCLSAVTTVQGLPCHPSLIM